MTAADLLTVGYFDAWARALLARVEAPAATAAPAAPVLYSLAGLADTLHLHVDTVRRWLTKGKKAENGTLVKLQAYYFTSEPRIPWPAVLAYHRGEAFDLDSLPAPMPLPAAPPIPPPLSLLDGQPHLRVA